MKVKKTVLIILCLLTCSACAKYEDTTLPTFEDYNTTTEPEQRKDLKLGVVSGPYEVMFRETIQPLFEEEGYTIEVVVYENYTQPNIALAEGEIDLNLFQNYKYLNNFKAVHDLALSAVTEVPTLSMGIFSKQYDSLDDIRNGTTIAIPNDVTNLARALMLLESADIVRIDSFIDKSKATVDDLVENTKGIKFVLLEASELVNSLNRYDMAVITGNYVINSGLEISDSLYEEVLGDSYFNVIAVRTEDLSQGFVKKIIEWSHSEEVNALLFASEEKYGGFQYPKTFLDTRE